ncbi:MAG TPA: DUF4124 domain-containing protein [Pseudomonas sp.]|nr:DUF4124 domain-containing protein [Pseudomonas sp.]
MPALRHLVLLPLLTCALSAQAQIYTWVDADGQKHFGSTPPASEQSVQPIEIRPTAPGSSQPAPVPAMEQPNLPSTAPESPPAAQAASTPAAPSAHKMCSDAIHWTSIDLPKLKEIAVERRRQGRLNQSQYQRVTKALDQVKSEASMANCLASEDKERRQFECLSQGLGIIVCAGALSEALNKL